MNTTNAATVAAQLFQQPHSSHRLYLESKKNFRDDNTTLPSFVLDVRRVLLIAAAMEKEQNAVWHDPGHPFDETVLM